MVIKRQISVRKKTSSILRAPDFWEELEPVTELVPADTHLGDYVELMSQTQR